MSDHYEDRIETVMRTLGRAEPPPNMERRILVRLQSAQAPRANRFWSAFSHSRYALAACVMTAAVLGVLLQRQAVKGHTSNTTARAQHRERLELPGHASGAMVADHASAPPAPPSVARMVGPRFVEARHSVRTPLHAQIAEDDRSFPAPPLPLTEQEKLLLRLVRHESTTQLAGLSAPAREAAFQRDKERVTEFFVTYSPPDDAPTTPISGQP